MKVSPMSRAGVGRGPGLPPRLLYWDRHSVPKQPRYPQVAGAALAVSHKGLSGAGEWDTKKYPTRKHREMSLAE